MVAMPVKALLPDVFERYKERKNGDSASGINDVELESGAQS
jgi:hypothetical protein